MEAVSDNYLLLRRARNASFDSQIQPTQLLSLMLLYSGQYWDALVCSKMTVKRQSFECRGSIWSWSLEQSLFSPGLTCINEAACQFRIICNDIAERCDFSKYCRKQVSGLTLCFINSQNSGYLLFQKCCCKQYWVMCDRRFTAFSASL